MPIVLMTEARRRTRRLLRAVRRIALAWDIDFHGDRTIAVLGREAEIMAWARRRAEVRGVAKWSSRPFPGFNDRYEGEFKIANVPSWVLVRPRSDKPKRFMEGTL